MKNNPIGIFDSGVGGLSIWKHIHTLMPLESTIYIADSKNAPYGEKSPDEITKLSILCTEFLLKHDVKAIVVACNTATTNAINYLRATYSIPFIGIEPATKPAAIATKTGKIGILATKGTLASELFLNTSQAYRGDVEIIERVGKGLVDIVESGNLENAKPLLEEYLTPMIEAGVDNIVLGCTHYPFLKPVIEKIIPDGISIVDSGAAVARQTKSILNSKNISAHRQDPADHKLFTSGDLSLASYFAQHVGQGKFSIERYEPIS